jgi:Holliday junction resolvase
MGMMQREKGKRGEREAAAKLTELLGVPVRRSQQFRGTHEAADLHGVPGLHIEVKRCERLSLYEALEKVESESGDDCPMVLHRRNGKRWVAVMYLADLVDVSEAVNRNRQRAQTCP